MVRPENRFDAQLFGNVLPMRDYGGQADIQFVRDLFVDQSFGDQDQHLDFACREFVSGGRRVGGMSFTG